MTHVLCQTVLWMDSLLPEDYAINTWHLDVNSVDPVDGATEFFADITTFFLAIDTYLSRQLEGTMAFRAYDMSEPEPRVPIYINGSALTPGSGQLPSEVALCMSFQGVRVSGENQARRRGRVYLGPLGITVTGGRPDSTAITAIAAAGGQLLSDSDNATNYTWSVYSATDDLLVAVNNGWVDNAFDTQRRRGISPTSRVTFT